VKSFFSIYEKTSVPPQNCGFDHIDFRMSGIGFELTFRQRYPFGCVRSDNQFGDTGSNDRPCTTTRKNAGTPASRRIARHALGSHATTSRHEDRRSCEEALYKPPNINYGFRGNLLGLKLVALAVDAFLIVATSLMLFIAIRFGITISILIPLLTIGVGSAVHALLFVRCVSNSSVYQAGCQYARQLILSCDRFLSKDDPPKRGRIEYKSSTNSP